MDSAYCETVAERAQMKSEMLAARNVRTMCMVVPLRLGCFVHGILTLFISLSLLLLQGYGEWFFIGVDKHSRIIIRILEVTGALISTNAIFGSWNADVAQLRIWLVYQLLRAAGWAGVMIINLPLMYECQKFSEDVQGAIHEFGWKPQMYEISVENECDWVQPTHFLVSIYLLLILLYLAYSTWVLIQDIEERIPFVMASKHVDQNVLKCAAGRPPRGMWSGSAEAERRLVQDHAGEHEGLLGAGTGLESYLANRERGEANKGSHVPWRADGVGPQAVGEGIAGRHQPMGYPAV